MVFFSRRLTSTLKTCDIQSRLGPTDQQLRHLTLELQTDVGSAGFLDGKLHAVVKLRTSFDMMDQTRLAAGQIGLTIPTVAVQKPNAKSRRVRV